VGGGGGGGLGAGGRGPRAAAAKQPAAPATDRLQPHSLQLHLRKRQHNHHPPAPPPGGTPPSCARPRAPRRRRRSRSSSSSSRRRRRRRSGGGRRRWRRRRRRRAWTPRRQRAWLRWWRRVRTRAARCTRRPCASRAASGDTWWVAACPATCPATCPAVCPAVCPAARLPGHLAARPLDGGVLGRRTSGALARPSSLPSTHPTTFPPTTHHTTTHHPPTIPPPPPPPHHHRRPGAQGVQGLPAGRRHLGDPLLARRLRRRHERAQHAQAARPHQRAGGRAGPAHPLRLRPAMPRGTSARGAAAPERRAPPAGPRRWLCWAARCT
jgi:hypothetical protein